jgi:hypothetical protein
MRGKWNEEKKEVLMDLIGFCEVFSRLNSVSMERVWRAMDKGGVAADLRDLAERIEEVEFRI